MRITNLRFQITLRTVLAAVDYSWSTIKAGIMV